MAESSELFSHVEEMQESLREAENLLRDGELKKAFEIVNGMSDGIDCPICKNAEHAMALALTYLKMLPADPEILESQYMSIADVMNHLADDELEEAKSNLQSKL